MYRSNLLTNWFSTANSWSRGKDRLWRVGLTGMSSVMAQGVTIVTGMISVPLTIGYLGVGRYGVWLTINSLLQWLFISNVGFGGNALINKLSAANGTDNRELAQELVSSAFCGVIGVAIILLCLFAGCFYFVDWPLIFNVTGVVPSHELTLAVAIAFVCYVMTFPASLVEAVYQSYQKGYVGNIWNATGSIVSLIALVIVTRMQGGLPFLVAALFGVRLIFTFATAAHLFYVHSPWLRPSYKKMTKGSLKALISLGSTYIVAQLAGIALTQSQPLIITQLLGPTHIAGFSVAMRVMFLPAQLILMFVFPLMPAYGEAKARNDWPWIYDALRNSIIATTVMTGPLVVILIIFARKIVDLWVGPELVPSQYLVYGLGAQVLIGNISTPISVMIYGLEKAKIAAAITVTHALVFIGCGISLTKMWGEIGLVYAMVISLFLTGFMGQIVYLYFFYRKRRSIFSAADSL